ncbi:uncharacterized protein METZ01_LOCUS71589 [marine metagenome]|uniref:Uncharacterized protein n=1 Tax=marine metagenome TaxID=408172 RepID=A0A381TRR3_9ZZZZ
MNYKRKYIMLKEAGLIDETDILLLYSCDRTIIQQIKNKRRRLNDLFESSNQKITLIQNNVRNFLIRQKFKDFSAQYKNMYINYQNNYTLLGDEIKNVPKFYFYKYCESDSQYYAFDIRSLNEILKIGNKNPYTLNDFPNSIVLQIKRIIKKLIDNKFDVIVPSIIPKESIVTSTLASTYNKMKFLNIYPDIDKLLKFNITFLFYYLQDMMTSPLLDKFIDKTIYHKVIDIYNIYSRTRLSKSTEKKYQDQILLYILKIINNILDITDDYQHIRALAINEIIHNNYEIFGDNSSSNNNTITTLQQNSNNILNLDDEMENVD